MLVLRNLLLGVLLAWQCMAWGQGVLAVPQLTGRVIDQTGTLDAATQRNLADKLNALEQEKGSQVVVLMVSSTMPEDIASYANRVANEWKIGRKGVGDGVLILVAKNDRKLRIEVAKTLEGAIPDLAAKQIIDEAITPSFKRNEYGAGLSAAVNQIAARIRGEALPAPRRDSSSLQGFQWFDLLAFLLVGAPIIASVLISMFGHRHGSLLTGMASGAGVYWFTRSWLLLGLVGLAVAFFSFLSNSRKSRRSGSNSAGADSGNWTFGSSDSGSSWDGSSSSDGGFSSGGGGDFGGGGASGDW